MERGSSSREKGDVQQQERLQRQRRQQERPFRFSIDRGGTFTDVYAEVPGVKGFRVLKLLSEDPDNYRDAPREGVRRILEVSQYLYSTEVFSTVPQRMRNGDAKEKLRLPTHSKWNSTNLIRNQILGKRLDR